MHDNSRTLMRRILARYAPTAGRLLDVGAYDVNGTYRQDVGALEYTGCDVQAGPNVDMVMTGPAAIPAESGAYDVVISGQTLEHAEDPRALMVEMARVLRPGGLLVVIAPSTGALHRYPVDCWRILPDGMRALGKAAGLRELEITWSQVDPYRDVAGAWRKPGPDEPRLSVVTPTHNTQWLPEVADSLRAQDFTGSWEWLIVPNNGAEIDAGQFDDLPVRVVPMGGEAKGVGAIKAFAFGQARGEIHVELDHDDLLTPHALTTIDRAFTEHPEAVLAYSNSGEFWDGTDEPNTYDTRYGWLHRDREFYGRKFVELRGFPPSPAMMRHVNFAPNHVRAWWADAYRAVGGHDATLALADDHDLMCRLYVHGPAHWIDDCLYLYRCYEGQTWRQSQGKPGSAANTSQQVYLKHGRAMAEAWCRRDGLPMLDLGAAHNPQAGYVGVDRREAPGVNVVCDLDRDRLPYADSSVGLIRAVDFLEHLVNPVAVMNELYRVLAPGGWILTATPSTDGRGACMDPTHRTGWNSNSWWYYTQRRFAQYVPEITCRFQVARLDNGYPSDWHRLHQIPYVYADLIAIKGDIRLPGEVLI